MSGVGKRGWVWDDCALACGIGDEWWLKAGLGTLAALSVWCEVTVMGCGGRRQAKSCISDMLT